MKKHMKVLVKTVGFLLAIITFLFLKIVRNTFDALSPSWAFNLFLEIWIVSAIAYFIARPSLHKAMRKYAADSGKPMPDIKRWHVIVALPAMSAICTFLLLLAL